MKDYQRYLLYRVYSKKERPDINSNGRIIFYGWTNNKNVVKAFFQQRDKSKYRVYKTNLEELGEKFSENDLESNNFIDYLPLKFVSSGEKINFFLTMNEMQETEVRIQRYFREKCELVVIDEGKTNLLNLFLNLDDYYADALEYIGFIPPEINALFPSVDQLVDDDIEYNISLGYDIYYGAPVERSKHLSTAPGLNMVDKVYMKILYSVESFVKILKEEL
jgi:hypothetical protein